MLEIGFSVLFLKREMERIRHVTLIALDCTKLLNFDTFVIVPEMYVKIKVLKF
jgi:hypothetical protein